jgi:bacteriocin-like protein
MDKQNDPKGKRVTSRDRKLGADKERAGREKTELSDDDLRQVSGGASSQIPKTKQPV